VLTLTVLLCWPWLYCCVDLGCIVGDGLDCIVVLALTVVVVLSVVVTVVVLVLTIVIAVDVVWGFAAVLV
jgi:hypothetical protein